ncbi:hypothetical protein [Streptomyces asiaticus]|uniref:hypothetical protein n=1 Tax=Streptomyces asiaticus TaxID=114695 RepID=UPI001BA8717E|nr:hypothetical protein [Streptomyces asiaticus]
MRPAIPAEAFDHGDPRRYRRGCRCTPCTKATTAENRRRHYLRETGRGTRTSPHRAANHITRLRNAGMSDREIQAAANIVPDLFYRIMRGASDIHRNTEARILAVQPTPQAENRCGAQTPALGTIRRLRALAADGWPAAELGRRLGKHKQFIVFLQNTDTNTEPRTRLWVAAYVRNLCTELAGLTPEDNGVPAHFAHATRKRAAAKDWVPTSYWDEDDYDNPHFVPATQEPARHIVVGENALELINQQGYSRRDAAARLGISLTALEVNIRRYRDELEEAA